MRLLIPFIKKIEVPKDCYNYFICEFNQYYINISQPHSEIKYELNKKELTEYSGNTDVLIKHDPGTDVIYEFMINRYIETKESSIYIIITVIIIPFLMSIFSILMTINNKETKLRLRVKVLYWVSILSPIAIIPICIVFKMEVWVYIVLAVLYLFIYILIISNCIDDIKAFIGRQKVKRQVQQD